MATDEDPEVQMLRDQIKEMTTTYFREKQLWLKEKVALQQATAGEGLSPASAPHSRRTFSSVCSEPCSSESAASGDDNGSISLRDPSSCSFTGCSISRGASSASAIPGVAGASPSAQAEQLAAALAEAQKQLEEAKRQQDAAAARWTREREGLQRQVHALISMNGADDPSCRSQPQSDPQEEGQEGLGERRALEALVGELQADRANLEEQLRHVTAEAARATRQGSAAPTPRHSEVAAAAAVALQPLAPAASAPASAAISGGGSGGPGWALTLTESVNLPALLAEKATLEREVRHYREECVAVPRAEYTELSSMRSQMAFLDAEMQQLRDEAAEAVRQREAAEAELEQMLEECVSVPHAEYQALLRQAAEARAREATSVLEGGSGSGGGGGGRVAIGQDEHRMLLAAVKERDALAAHVTTLHMEMQRSASASATATFSDAAEAEAVTAALAAASEQQQQRAAASEDDPAEAEEAKAEAAAAAGYAAEGEAAAEVIVLREQLSAAVAASVAESGRLAARLRELEEEVERLRSERGALLAESGAFRSALVSGRMQASDEARAVAASAEAARAAATGELGVVLHRLRTLESDLASARETAAAALAAREVLLLELSTVRDAAVRTTQALADCEGRREEAEQIAVSAMHGLSSSREELTAMRAAAVAAAAEVAAAVALREEAQQVAVSAMHGLASSREELAAVRAAAAAAAAEAAEATTELVQVKVELAEARELEVLFKRDVFKSKRMLHGLPQEWMSQSQSMASVGGCTNSSSAGGAGGGGSTGGGHSRWVSAESAPPAATAVSSAAAVAASAAVAPVASAVLMSTAVTEESDVEEGLE